MAPNSSSVDFERLRAVGAQCAAGRCQVLLADNSVKSLKVENLREAEAIGAKMISRHQLYINTMMIPLDSRMVIVIPGYSTVNHGEWQNHTVLICFIPAADGNDEWHQVAFKTLRSYAGLDGCSCPIERRLLDSD